MTNAMTSTLNADGLFGQAGHAQRLRLMRGISRVLERLLAHEHPDREVRLHRQTFSCADLCAIDVSELRQATRVRFPGGTRTRFTVRMRSAGETSPPSRARHDGRWCVAGRAAESARVDRGMLIVDGARVPPNIRSF